MIPFVAVVGVRKQRRRGFRLWIPLIFVWLLLLPFLLLLLPFAVAACQLAGMKPFRTFWYLWHVLSSMGGTCFEIETREAAVSVRLF
jgi:hypothetical protein